MIPPDVEMAARRMAAAKMLLRDPSGSKLPDDLWMQYLKQGERAVEFDRKAHLMIDRVTGEPIGFPPEKR